MATGSLETSKFLFPNSLPRYPGPGEEKQQLSCHKPLENLVIWGCEVTLLEKVALNWNGSQPNFQSHSLRSEQPETGPTPRTCGYSGRHVFIHSTDIYRTLATSQVGCSARSADKLWSWNKSSGSLSPAGLSHHDGPSMVSGLPVFSHSWSLRGCVECRPLEPHHHHLDGSHATSTPPPRPSPRQGQTLREGLRPALFRSYCPVAIDQ